MRNRIEDRMISNLDFQRQKNRILALRPKPVTPERVRVYQQPTLAGFDFEAAVAREMKKLAMQVGSL